jgi:hypothetical protein
MTFANGYTISVQFGTFNYCSNRDLTAAASYDAWRTGQDAHASSDAEVAVIAPNGDFVKFDKFGDHVRGHTDSDTVAKIIAWVAAQRN